MQKEDNTLCMGGRWFHMLNNCIKYFETHVSEVQFRWFIDIVAYLQFFTGETFIPRESHLYGIHGAKIRKTNDKYIVISSFKNDTPTSLSW